MNSVLIHNFVHFVFLSVGIVMVVVSLGGFWSIRQKTTRREEALLRQLLFLYFFFSLFLVCASCLLFILQYFFLWYSALLFSWYISVSSTAGMVFYVWSCHAIFSTLPGRARDTYPPMLPAIILIFFSQALGVFLDYDLQTLIYALVPRIDVHLVGSIGIFIEVLAFLITFSLNLLFLVHYRRDKTMKDGMLW